MAFKISWIDNHSDYRPKQSWLFEKSFVTNCHLYFYNPRDIANDTCIRCSLDGNSISLAISNGISDACDRNGYSRRNPET